MRVGEMPENVLQQVMPTRPQNPFLPPEKVNEYRRAMGERLRMTRLEIDENRTRFAEMFGVLNNRWRMWEEGTHAADEWVMVEMCDRHELTLDWLYRGRIETLPHRLQAKLFKKYPKLLDGLLDRGLTTPGSIAIPSMDQHRPPVPDEPATGRRRKPAKKLSSAQSARG